MMVSAVYRRSRGAVDRNVSTHRFERAYGPLVVDDWEAAVPSGEPPVLLIHGWGGTGRYWQDTAMQLSETVRVLVPDLPGTGRSQPVSKVMDLFDEVDVLIDILNTLGLDRVQVVGHSMGGAMALLLADRCADRVERVVLASLTFFRTEFQKRVYQNVMLGLKPFLRLRAEWMASIPGGATMLAQHYFYRVPNDKNLLQLGLLDFLKLDFKTAMACADDGTSDLIPEAGSRLRVPVFLIAGRNDKMMPMENVQYTQHIFQDCRVHWIEKCGHLPMIEKREEFLMLLKGFLRLGNAVSVQPSATNS